MISASHNLFDDNGIKLFGPEGYKLSDEVEGQIEDLMDENLDRKLAASAQLGRARRIDGVHDRYIEFAKRTLPRTLNLEGLRVVVDAANGAAYKVVPEALWELGGRRGGDRRRSRRLQHQQGVRLDRARGDERQGCARCVPISALRSTGDADRVIIATSAATSSMATSCSPSSRKAGWRMAA